MRLLSLPPSSASLDKRENRSIPYSPSHPREQSDSSAFLVFASLPIACLVLAVLSQYSGFDLWLSSQFFDSDTLSWPWREHWLTQGVLHEGAQLLVKLFGLAFACALAVQAIAFRKHPNARAWWATFVAMLIGPLFIGYLKSSSHLACPWDEQPFGGSSPHLRIFDPVPPDTSKGYGFPSAHASSGYAFVALYYLAALFKSSKRFHGMTLGLVLGIVFGAAQQARGAHFLSHDLFALSICWTLSGCVFASFYPQRASLLIGYVKKPRPQSPSIELCS